MGGGDMKIREGAYYRTRHGDVVGPMRRTFDQFWYNCDHTWNEDGGIYLSGAEHGLDLISEVYVSDTPPTDAPAPEAKTLRDEFAMALMDADAFMVGFKEHAEQLYRAADAMMEARKK
jgi:hypothetical protein